ncbi:MAG: calcium/sodium antiporter [Bacteroidia bacterium]|nr:calcium/sodium antiporter [Bacteroidia bacterium]
MILTVLLILLSLAILYFTADWLVLGGASLAQRLGVSPLIVGLTIVSFGTSAPELLVSIQSSLSGQGALAVGNVVGSNMFNIGIILGISALIYPLLVKHQLFKIDVPVMIIATVAFLVTFYNGKLNFFEGFLFLVIFVSYMLYIIYKALKNKQRTKTESGFKMTRHWLVDVSLIVVGLVGLVYGSDLLVNNSIVLAREWGMSEALIGLTIVAAGTSMPELATSVVAALKRQSDIAIGNVIGSNIFNILLILGTAGVITPIETAEINLFDGAYLLVTTLILFFFMRTGRSVNRKEGLILIIIYFMYFFYKLLV